LPARSAAFSVDRSEAGQHLGLLRLALLLGQDARLVTIKHVWSTGGRAQGGIKPRIPVCYDYGGLRTPSVVCRGSRLLARFAGRLGMNYLNQLMGQGEFVVFLTRRHGSVLLPALLLALVLCALIIGAAAGLYWYSNVGELALSGLALLVLPLLWLAWRIVVWQNEVFVVTTRRVIHLRGVVNKDVLDSSLAKVTDIALRQPLLGRMFNYGDLEILTASEIGANRFTRITSPLQFKAALLNAKEELDRPPAQLPETSPSTDPANLLVSLKTLLDQGVLTEEEYQAKKADLLARF
jgi:hypothetical protein